MTQLRTFIAIEVGKEIRKAGVSIAEEFSTVVDGVRWVRPENIHVTLKFLGEVDDRDLHPVCKIATSTAAQFKQFSISSNSVGAFPDIERPGTIWMGIDDDGGKLANLQELLETELAQIGFPVEHRPFKPHATLGRIRSRQRNEEMTGLFEKMTGRDFGMVLVRELVVFSSELERGGPTYTVLARCPLA